MEIGVTLVKAINPEQASRLKYYANMASRFVLSQKSGSRQWRYMLTSSTDVTASAPDSTNVTESTIRYRQSTTGEFVADKVVLRGSNPEIGHNAYAILTPISLQSFGHSHPSAGMLIAHSYNSSTTIRCMGYAAGYDTTQNNFAIRRTPNATRSFLSYEQLPDAANQRANISAFEWQESYLESNQAITTSITQNDTSSIAYCSISADIMTGNDQTEIDDYTFKIFHHTRQTILDKSNGVLYVYDSVHPNSTISSNTFSYGQIWHLNNILQNVTTNANYSFYIAQNGPYYIYDDDSYDRGALFYLQMAGGGSTVAENTVQYWEFDPAMSDQKWPLYHVYSQADVAWDTQWNNSYGFVSVIIPFGRDGNATEVVEEEVPGGVTTVVDSGGNAVVGYGGLCIAFKTDGSFEMGVKWC